MAESLRKKVKIALSERLKVITSANGYSADVGQNVFRGRTLFGDDDPVPFISILEDPIGEDLEFAPETGKTSQGPYVLMVQGFAKDDKENPTDTADDLLEDIKTVLREVRGEAGHEKRIFQFPQQAPTVLNMEFGGGVVRPSDELSAKAYCWVRVTFDLMDDQ